MIRRIGRKGSSTIFLAIAFLAFAIAVAGAICISRRLAVMSECQAFGRVCTRAILSEYVRHLLEDYKLMAYWGNEIEVNRRVDAYMSYSAADKLGIRIGKTVSDLSGYEIGDPDNFRTALRKGFPGSAAASLLSGSGRLPRGNITDKTGIAIGNRVVLDTLPSGGAGGTVSSDSLIEKAKSAVNSSCYEGILKKVRN